MSRGALLWVAVCTAACRMEAAPDGFGVDLTARVNAALRGRVAGLSLEVSGAEAWKSAFSIGDLDGNELRVRYVPLVHTGALLFLMTASSSAGAVVGAGFSDPVNLIDGQAVPANLRIDPVGTDADLAAAPLDLSAADLTPPDLAGADLLGVDLVMNDPVPDLARPFKYIFVTSSAVGPNIGVAGADTFCMVRAAAGNMDGTYRAWLSTDGNTVSARFAPSSLPYVLRDGVTPVASGWSELTSGTLQHAIDQTELLGSPMPPATSLGCGLTLDDVVWTNTTEAGDFVTTTGDCGDWSGADADAVVGHYHQNKFWSHGTTCGQTYHPCTSGNPAPLYCVEQ